MLTMNTYHSVRYIITLRVRTAFEFFSYGDQTFAHVRTLPQWFVEPCLKWTFFFDKFYEYILKFIFH